MRLYLRYLAIHSLFLPLSCFYIHSYRDIRLNRMKTIDSFFKKTKVASIASSTITSSEEPTAKKQKIEDEIKSPDTVSSVVVTPEAPKPLPAAEEWIQLSYLADDWRSRLHNEFNKPYFKRLQAFVDAERSSKTIYPPVEETFTAFNLCSFDDIRVVIIGQDPYHGPNQAHGLAFSVKQGVQNPPSLQNVFNEAQADVHIRKPRHGNLEHWSRQGVFLLNTALTVRRGEANSHQKKG
jgi:hypothetical protein